MVGLCVLTHADRVVQGEAKLAGHDTVVVVAGLLEEPAIGCRGILSWARKQTRYYLEQTQCAPTRQDAP